MLPILAATAAGQELDFPPLLDQPRATRPRPAPQKPSPRDPQPDAEIPSDTPASLDGGETVNPRLLRPVRDSTLGLEVVDRPAYFLTLWLCQQVDRETVGQFAAALRAARRADASELTARPAPPFSTYVDVFRHPEEYRGRPVTLRGRLRRLVAYDPGPNDVEITRVYEAWLYPDDARGNPAVVVFTQKSDGLPLGGELHEDVQFSGYFLKLYGYDAQDTTRQAPLFLAADVQWSPRPRMVAAAAVPLWGYGAACLAVFGVGWLLRFLHADQPRWSKHALSGVCFDESSPQTIEHQH